MSVVDSRKPQDVMTRKTWWPQSAWISFETIFIQWQTLMIVEDLMRGIEKEMIW